MLRVLKCNLQVNLKYTLCQHFVTQLSFEENAQYHGALIRWSLFRMGAFLFRIYNFIWLHIWFIDMRRWDWKVSDRNAIFTHEILLTWQRRCLKVKVSRFREVNTNFVEKFWEARDRIFHWPRRVLLLQIMAELLHHVLPKLLHSLPGHRFSKLITIEELNEILMSMTCKI